MYRPEIGIRCKKLGINKDFYNEDEAYTYMAAKFPDINKEYFYTKGFWLYKYEDKNIYIINIILEQVLNMERWYSENKNMEYIRLPDGNRFIVLNRGKDDVEYFCQKYSRGHMVYHTRQLSPYPRNGRLTVSINKQRYRIDDLCKEIDKKYSV